MTNRREMMLRGLLCALAPSLAGAGEPANHDFHQAPETDDDRRRWMGDETVAMLLYPHFTALDLFGPHHMFGNLMGAKVMLVAETADPVVSDMGEKVVPTMTITECPERLTILFVPGGTTGTLKAAENPAIRDFVASRGAQAEWVTSVCTGSLILGAVGLLDGYRATSHWAARSQLALFGATPVAERVVIDRNRVTGAGVTSGLDFGLSLVQKLRGTEYAQSLQLLSEYDPKPPLDAGNERKAPKAVVANMLNMLNDFSVEIEHLARRVVTVRAAK